MKRMICVVTAIAILLSLSCGVFATDVNEAQEIIDASVVTQEVGDDLWTLAGTDYANGDCEFKLYENGVLISSSYLDSETGMITTTDYDSSGFLTTVATKTVEMSKRSPQAVVKSPPAGCTYVGAIQYTYGDGDNTRTADVGYKLVTDTNGTYDVTGAFKNITAFAAYVADLLAVVTAIASPLAAGILSAVGIAISTVNFIVPHIEVAAVVSTMTWKASWREAGGLPSSVVGTQCIANIGGDGAKTYTTGPYFPPRAFSERDRSLASMLYDGGWWSYDETYGTVVKWIPA